MAYEWPKPGIADPQPKLSFVAGFQPWGWVIGTGVYIDDLQQQLWSSAKRSLTVGSVIIAFIGVVTVFSVRRMSAALRAMTVAMAEWAAGKFDVVLPGLGRKDEIGDIAAAVEAFKRKAIEKAHLESEAEALRHQRETDATAQRQRAEQELQMKAAEERAKAAEEVAWVMRSLAQGLKRLSSGDLACRLDDEFSPAYQQIRDDFNTALSGLQETVGSIVDVAREVAGASAEISASTTDLSQRTEEQAASLEHTSASMKEISGTVKQNAQSAEAANASASATCDVAQHNSEVVTKAVAAMARIEESSRKISDIIGVIDEIARQTNLLALNAAVEAARAGEAGRGFAVVASEVRSLAQRSAQAANDIKDLITNSSVQVREGADLVNGAGASLGEFAEFDKKSGGDHRRHRQCQHRAGDRNRANQQDADAIGRGDPTELGAGRGECRHRQVAGATGQGDGRADLVLQAHRRSRQSTGGVDRPARPPGRHRRSVTPFTFDRMAPGYSPRR